MSATIRPARVADFSDWARLRHCLWPSLSVDAALAEIEKLFPRENFAGFVAESERAIVGFCEVSIREAANGCESSPVVFLEGIYIEEKFRRGGVGKALVVAVEKWALAHDIREIGSDTEIENVASQSAHVVWGFSETERVVYFRKPL